MDSNDRLAGQAGPFGKQEAVRARAVSLEGQRSDGLLELTWPERKRVHNLKYYTWVEQQGKTYEEIQDMWCQPDYWTAVQKQAGAIDELITEFNAEVGLV